MWGCPDATSHDAESAAPTSGASDRRAQRWLANAPTYGLDIETDTRVNGLDPAVAPIIAVAVADGSRDAVFSGPEARLLRDLDDHLASLTPGVLITWNGAAFDLPFIAARARARGLALGLRLRAAPSMPIRSPLAGHRYGYRGAWFGHTHLDAYRVYRNDLPRLLDVSCSLKSVAELLGFRPVKEDAGRVHELDTASLHRYVSSDASLARLTAARRWSTATAFADLTALPPSQHDQAVAQAS